MHYSRKCYIYLRGGSLSNIYTHVLYVRILCCNLQKYPDVATVFNNRRTTSLCKRTKAILAFVPPVYWSMVVLASLGLSYPCTLCIGSSLMSTLYGRYYSGQWSLYGFLKSFFAVFPAGALLWYFSTYTQIYAYNAIHKKILLNLKRQNNSILARLFRDHDDLVRISGIFNHTFSPIIFLVYYVATVPSEVAFT